MAEKVAKVAVIIGRPKPPTFSNSPSELFGGEHKKEKLPFSASIREVSNGLQVSCSKPGGDYRMSEMNASSIEEACSMVKKGYEKCCGKSGMGMGEDFHEASGEDEGPEMEQDETMGMEDEE